MNSLRLSFYFSHLAILSFSNDILNSISIQIDTTNEDQIAFDMYTFLQEFFQLYPKYNKLPFFLLGESVCINPFFSSISLHFICTSHSISLLIFSLYSMLATMSPRLPMQLHKVGAILVLRLHKPISVPIQDRSFIPFQY